MGKVYFLFGVHNHQPVGNFEHVFKKAYETCYLPFLSILEKFPKIKFSIHNSGPLYDWFLKNAKDYLEILRKLTERKQIEIISGGYYEPILPLILEKDRKGQILFMNDFIKNQFKVSPEGIWIAERVWEPNLPLIINECNLKYTFLDDTHFRYAGLKEKEFFGYYTTEEQGKSIFVFPISKTLRYKIPFSQAYEAIELLNSFRKDEDTLITLFDDGEKFGLWPHTYEWVYEKGWLYNFLSLLEKSPYIETITPKEAINKFFSKGIIYLPTASYEEMGEWVLEPQIFFIYEELQNFLKTHPKFEDFKYFLRGGFFKNFYRKYPRLNYMHKRMLYLSKKINSETSFEENRELFINLWKAQTNCSYWHGIFGGFYLGHLRSAVYENLIKAENIFDKNYRKENISFEEVDIDLDGYKEIIFKNDKFIFCFSCKNGALLELSLREPPFNLINTITRREESYHKKINKNSLKKDTITTIHEIVKQKEENLDRFLIYDKYERLGLIEHLLDKKLTIEDFESQKGIYTLSDRIYNYEINKKQSFLDFRYSKDNLDFLKQIKFSDFGFETYYKFYKKDFWKNYNFGIEFSLSFPSLKDIFKKERTKNISLNKEIIFKNATSFVILDNYKKIILEFKFDKTDTFSLPLYSVSSSEEGFEKVFQQLVLLFLIKNKTDTFNLSLNIKTQK